MGVLGENPPHNTPFQPILTHTGQDNPQGKPGFSRLFINNQKSPGWSRSPMAAKRARGRQLPGTAEADAPDEIGTRSRRLSPAGIFADFRRTVCANGLSLNPLNAFQHGSMSLFWRRAARDLARHVPFKRSDFREKGSPLAGTLQGRDEPSTFQLQLGPPF